MHTVHAGFSFVCPVAPGAEGKAKKVLEDMRASVAVFKQAKSTHAVTASVLPAQMRGKRELPATLLFLTSYWGSTRVHLDELCQHAGTQLRELFSHCRDQPAPDCSAAELAAYMRRHRKPDTFYSGMHHVTHQQVLDDQTLRHEIEKYVDGNADLIGLTAAEAQEKIQTFVRSRPDLMAISQPRCPTWWDWTVKWRHVIALFSILIALAVLGVTALVTKSQAVDDAATVSLAAAGAVVVGLVFLFLVMRVHERGDGPTVKRQPDARVREMEDTQLNPVINEFTVAGPIKGGFFRPIFLRILLWIVVRYIILKKRKIKTVATARWLAIDGGRRLIFVSNYTNMAEGYVRDFIDTVSGAGAINLVFSWGVGYPRTRFTYGRGARDDSNGFIYVVHNQMKHTGLWYCPFQNVSIDNININRVLRERLFGTCKRCRKLPAQDWLRHL